MTARILLVDDEPDILAPVRYALERDGFSVEVALDGERGVELARGGGFDVVVLDVMLPRLSGLEACRALRNESDVPIIMLTARDDEVDRVLGLELGADDYVTKPFSTAELVSRIRAILRRRQLDRASGGAIREAGGIRIDLDQHRVDVDGMEVELTPSEFRILLLLVDRPGGRAEVGGGRPHAAAEDCRGDDEKTEGRELGERGHAGEGGAELHAPDVDGGTEHDRASGKVIGRPLVQAGIAVTVAVGLLGLDLAGDPWLLLVIALVDALLGVALGLFASAFARTEFQAVQFLPAFILPQILLCGLLAPRDQMADLLYWISWALPVTYAYSALDLVTPDVNVYLSGR